MANPGRPAGGGRDKWGEVVRGQDTAWGMKGSEVVERPGLVRAEVVPARLAPERAIDRLDRARRARDRHHDREEGDGRGGKAHPAEAAYREHGERKADPLERVLREGRAQDEIHDQRGEGPRAEHELAGGAIDGAKAEARRQCKGHDPGGHSPPRHVASERVLVRRKGDQRSYEAHLPKHGAIESSDSQDREQEDLALPRVQP